MANQRVNRRRQFTTEITETTEIGCLSWLLGVLGVLGGYLSARRIPT